MLLPFPGDLHEFKYDWTVQRLWEERLKLKTKEIAPTLKPALVCS